MIKIRKVGLVLGLIVALALLVVGPFACHGGLTPPGPGTSYPCGVRGVECSNGACCDENTICGVAGDPYARCEPGYCCYDGPHWPSASADAGPTTKKRQTPRASSR